MALNRTLGELTAELQGRLGFVAAGARAGVNQANMYNFLFNAQVQLYWMKDWRTLRRRVVKELGQDQQYADYPDELHPERITGISIKWDTEWGQFLKVGITPEMYTSSDLPGPPTHVDFEAQIEFYPVPETEYQMRIFGLRPLDRFTQEADRTTLDSDLVFLMALANAKAHYRHPDAQFYADQMQALLSNLKDANFTKRVYDSKPGPNRYHRPVVVGRDT